MNIHQRDRNSPEGASGSFDGPSLLDGTYDEQENAVAFQQAVQAWRTGEASSETNNKPREITPRRPSPRKTPSMYHSSINIKILVLKYIQSYF